MKKKAISRRQKVCLVSAHPLVLKEFERLLAHSEFHVDPCRIESPLLHNLSRLDIPKAPARFRRRHLGSLQRGALLVVAVGTWAAALQPIRMRKMSGSVIRVERTRQSSLGATTPCGILCLLHSKNLINFSLAQNHLRERNDS